MLLKVSLSDDPTGLQIAEWLKTYPPKNVTAVTIEALVLKARRLQGLTDSAAFPPGSILTKLSQSAQKEILGRLQTLNTVISTAAKSTQGTLVASDSVATGTAFDEMSSSVDAVCSAVETPILLEPQFSKPHALENAGEDEGAMAAGANDAISLRRHLLGVAAIPDGLNIPRDAVTIREHQDAERFRYGLISGKTVLLESFEYQPDPDTGNAFHETVQQLENMTALLCQSKRTSFHILSCVGYITEPLSKRFGLVFELPKGCVQPNPPVKLRDIYSSTRRVALGQRMRLAHALAVALENFHRVGWVHKEFRSDNIFFLSGCTRSALDEADPVNREVSVLLGTHQGEIDVGLPWLFGFEYSRAENAKSKLDADFLTENLVYRHPDRWGRPNVEFKKHHDVYSLVNISSPPLFTF